MYKLLMAMVALLPIIFLLRMVYTNDKHEKEPIWLVLKLFLYGGASCYLAYLCEKYGDVILKNFYAETTMQYKLIKTFVLVALCEEILKFFLLYIGSWRYKAFNYKYDALVFSVFTSLGFALVENYTYISSYGLKVGAMRGLTAIPMHASVAIFMGINYGAAKECASIGDNAGKNLLLFLGVFVAVLVHGVYDFCLSVDSVKSVLIFFGIVLAIYISTVISIKKYSKKDKAIINGN